MAREATWLGAEHEREDAMKRGSARIGCLVVAVLAAGVIVSCSSPERELRKAKAAGDEAALDAFLARHPEGPLAEQAKDAKEQLAFDAAKTANTALAYEGFLKRYPSRKLAPAARSAIEALELKEAQDKGTIAAYETFLYRHPKSAFAEQVGQALDRLLPSGVSATVGVPVTDSASCSASFAVTLRHKSGTLGTEVPEVKPGVMDCAGTVGSTGVEVLRVERPDPNHTILFLRSFNTAGWGGCHGTCRTTVSILGTEQAAFAIYK
jgi:hypothetical protein